MEIINFDDLGVEELNKELENGSRFIVFEYCISIIIMTFKQPTEIYFVRRGEGTFKHSFFPSFITFMLGWWGFPWGPIYSIGALYSNLRGGKDITHDIVLSLKKSDDYQGLKAPRRK